MGTRTKRKHRKRRARRHGVERRTVGNAILAEGFEEQRRDASVWAEKFGGDVHIVRGRLRVRYGWGMFRWAVLLLICWAVMLAVTWPGGYSRV